MGLLSTIGAASGRAFGLTRVGVLKDLYFNLVTLLLPGNGTNGAQNNTFTDSSSNNFSITRNPSTGPNAPTQGTFSPFSQTGWSNFFDGTGDKLTAAANAAFQFGTGDFAIEFWFYPTSLSGYQTPIDMGYNGSGSFIIQTGNGDGKPIFISAGSALITSSTAWTLNAFNHVVVCRSGTTLSMFINGARTATATNSTNFNSNSTLGVGAAATNSPDYPVVGYLSNVRLVKGSSVYDPTLTTLTVPTAPLTAITNTSLLTCQSNRFIDSSTNAFAITRNGTPSVQAFSPFAPTAAYDAATVGGSGYFDGSGDYLTVGAASDWTFLHNGSDWTCEFWVYHTTTEFDGIISTSAYSSEIGMSIYINLTTVSTVSVDIFRGASGSSALFTSNADLKLNQWNYVAVTFTSSTKTCAFTINGASAGSSSNTSFSYSASNPTNTLAIGRYQGSSGGSPGGNLTGYLGSLRISTNVRTGLTTVPTAPYTSDANTKLLCNFTNAGITDATAKNVLETVGGAQINTTQSKFGGSSMYFDGTGDYLIFPNSQNFALGSGDFTVEAWVFVEASKLQAIMDTRAVNTNTTGIALAIDASNFPYVYVNNATLFTSSTAITLNTWTHLAMVRSSGTITLYINGTKPSTGSAANTTNLTDTALTVGSVIDYRDTTATLHFNGYIDDLRITKGFARYTGNFTAPTAAFPLQ